MIRTRRNRGHRRGQGANRESVVPHGILEFLDMPALSLLLVLLCELRFRSVVLCCNSWLQHFGHVGTGTSALYMSYGM